VAAAEAENAGAQHGGAPTGEPRDPKARWAGRTFAAVIVLAVPVILYQGRNQWFFLDEWDFLAHRSAGSFHDLMAPHAQHWTTFGILVYRALWWLVGLRHYWPYLLCLLALHLTAAVLLRVVMRRAQVDPWIATAAASLFAVFGAGRQDIVFAFQIAFTGALAFGLAHMVLADHDGPFDRRDAIGILFGLVALMCSAIGVIMAIAVGISTLVRRGWRMAVAHTAPPAAVFLLWSATYGRDAYGGPKPAVAAVERFTRELLTAVFNGFGQIPGVGVAFAVVVVVGVPLAVIRQTWGDFRRFDGPTLALALAGGGFALSTAFGRSFDVSGFPAQASATRYVYIVAALLLPTVALAASAFVDRWRVALPAAIALFVVGLPANIAQLHANGAEAYTVGDPTMVLTLAHLPLARSVPRNLSPLPPPEDSFPIGWLLDGVASGRVPKQPPDVDRRTSATAGLYLSVYQTTDVPSGACVPIESGASVDVRPGDAIRFHGPLVTLRVRTDGRSVAQNSFSALRGRTLRIVGEPLELAVLPTPSDKPADLCR
jgi:hypothetical protein